MRTITFATIGTNFIVERFLAAAKLSKGFKLGAVYSRTRERGQAFIGEKTGVKLYTSLDDLAADPEIDAVYIASPTACHAQQSIQMLNGKKHVLCEKPAASNRREWQQMTAAAEKNGMVLLEAMRPIFSPGYQAIKAHLSAIGTIRRASFNFCQYSSRYDKFKAGIIENAFKPELGNGALMDIGIYCIESMVGLFGAPEKISASSYILKDSIDGMGSAVIDYDGMQSILSYSKISDSQLACEIQGEEGTITYQSAGMPQDVVLMKRSGEVQKLFDKPIEDDMLYELETFIELIKNKKAPKGFWTITDESLVTADEIRSQGGIKFPADKL